MKIAQRLRSITKEDKILQSVSRNTPVQGRQPEVLFSKKKSPKMKKKCKKDLPTSPDEKSKNYHTLSNKKPNNENKRHIKNQSLIKYTNNLENTNPIEKDQINISNISLKEVLRLEKSHEYQRPKDKEVLEMLKKGKDSFKENELQESINYFKATLEKDSNVLEARYLLSVCYLSGCQYDDSILQFQELIQKCPNFKRNMYLLCAIAFKKINDLQSAINVLHSATSIFPKYYDAYVYRGKLYVKTKNYEQAMKDFETSIVLNESRSFGYIGKADCLRFMNKFEEASELYTEAMGKEQSIAKLAILKRAITFIEAKQYDKASQDLQIITDNDPINSEAYYFKGLLYYKQKNLNEAILQFEQAIKHNNSRRAVTKSLYEIAKIKIELRDFYQAFYTLSRADYLDVDKKALEKFRVFTDGVTFLMKRKFKEGIENLTGLIKLDSLGDFLKSLVHSYRAYGYFCLGKHQKALNDLLHLEGFQKLDKASLYNKYLLQGIFAAQKNQFESAINYFLKSNKLYPNRMEPHFYKAMALIKFANKLIPKEDEQKIKYYFKNALKNLEKALELNPNNANLSYHLGLVRFAVMKSTDCIQDLDRAMEKSEDNVSKYFYCRGLVYSSLKLNKKALEDFSITISIDENFSDAYLNRAKCFFLTGVKNSALADLQKYTQLNPSNPEMHLWAGNFLFNIGAVEDALKAYSHIENLSNNPELLLLRCKCYIYLKELNQGLNDMQKIIDLSGQKEIVFDRDCLNGLKQASLASSNQYSRQSFQDSNKKLHALEKSEVEGMFFKFSDLQFYLGVNYFYLKNYEKALSHFNLSLDLKKKVLKDLEKKRKKEKEFQILISNEDEVIQDEPNELEAYDFDNKTYNIYEFQLNIAICFIMLKRFEEAFQHLSILQEILPEDDTKRGMEALLKVLQDEIQAQFEDLQEVSQGGEENQLIIIFPIHSRLCSIFPEFQLPFRVYRNLSMRLSFCLPRIELPSMQPQFDNKLIDNLSPTVVENKPEAPWIRRNQEGIVFTDNVQYFEDLDLKTESKRSLHENQDQKEEAVVKQQQFNYDDLMFDNSYQMNFYNDPNYHEKQQEDTFDRKKIKESLQLDANIENRLNKLLLKKQK